MNVEQFKKEIEEALEKVYKEKPFYGIPEKDYFRGQQDVLLWVLDQFEDEDGLLKYAP